MLFTNIVAHFADDYFLDTPTVLFVEENATQTDSSVDIICKCSGIENMSFSVESFKFKSIFVPPLSLKSMPQ